MRQKHAVSPVKPRRERIERLDWFIGAALFLFAASILYPFYNTLLISLVPQQDYVRSPFMLFPPTLTFKSYIDVFSNRFLMGGLLTTACITLVGTAYNLLLTVMTAFAMTRPFPGRKVVMRLIVFTMYFSGGLIPYYLLIGKLGLSDKLAVMILPMGFSVFYMLIVISFFEDIPISLQESARLDGANDLTILFRIILPLSLPVLATFALYYGVDRWNEWWHGMLFIKKSARQPLQLILRSIIQDVSYGDAVKAAEAMGEKNKFVEGIKMASIVITMVPILCVYPFLQKYFIAGLTMGGVKE